jgi:hypothetical protein
VFPTFVEQRDFTHEIHSVTTEGNAGAPGAAHTCGPD